ncbi:MAG: hypothetical protein MJZ30_02290 [Paludibacteraceae bacterium]|nr:hypothetical protein [Paludibacteraceae bacterium]
MIRKLFIYLCFQLTLFPIWAEEMINQHQMVSLSHVKGCQSVGIRGGKGTKSVYDVGLTYAYCFNSKISLLFELDHERWICRPKEKTEMSNVVLLSAGVEHNILNPTKWFYWQWGLGAVVGYDKWITKRLDHLVDKDFCYGAQVGTGVEFVPWTRVSFLLKAQQYALFSKVENYLKPNFSAAVRINFHK